MDVNHYKCRRCGGTMHCKARWGSAEFESGGFGLNSLKSVMFSEIEDDPDRPASSPDRIIGREVNDGDPDHNYTMTRDWNGDFSLQKKHRKPCHIRTAPAKDLVIKISIGEDLEPGEDGAFKRIELLQKCLSPCTRPHSMKSVPDLVNDVGLTEREVELLKCYLAGGHDYEFVGHNPSGSNKFVPVEKKENA